MGIWYIGRRIYYMVLLGGGNGNGNGNQLGLNAC